MCQRAKEEQEDAPTNLADNARWRFTNFGEDKFVRVGGVYNEAGYASKYELIWLPRQDQLQEMIEDETLFPAHRRATLIVNWLQNEQWFDKDGNSHWKHQINYDSMEQLWLAFVMKEKYNKVWNGEDWISA